MNSQLEKAERLQELHSSEGCFLIPNAWDVGSAKMLAHAGFPAIATTSAGIAFSEGCPDHGFAPVSARLDRKRMIERVGRIAQSLSIPISADLEGGYGESPNEVAETIREAMLAGVVGGNIEDYTGDIDEPLFELEHSIERIKAAREVIVKSSIPFVLVARTDCFLVKHPAAFAESVRRGNRFREAGADCIFIPGVSDRGTIQKLVREINAPINIVMGLTGTALSLPDLEALGVKRVSIGASLARAIYLQIRRAGEEMIKRGTFTFAEEQIAQKDLNEIMLNNPLAGNKLAHLN